MAISGRDSWIAALLDVQCLPQLAQASRDRIGLGYYGFKRGDARGFESAPGARSDF